MRALRYLLLLAAAGIAFYVYRDYKQARVVRDAAARVTPEALSGALNSRSSRWHYEQSTGESSRLLVSADGFSQGREDGAIELQGVELNIYHGDSEVFDRIHTEKAVFDVDANQLRSQTETHITLGVHSDDDQGDDDPRLTRIIAQEALFDTKSGAAQTASATRYFFEGGEARSIGSFYDSSRGYFEMKSDVEVERFASSPGGETTHIRAGRLVYEEDSDRVDLREGVSLVRGLRRIEADSAVVGLEEGKLRNILATNAVGGDQGEARQTTFRTPNLEAYYGAGQQLERVVGQGHSELSADSASSTMRAVGERVELLYEPDPAGGDSLLHEAYLRGKAEVDARPKQSGEARRKVTSEVIRLAMRPDGRDIEALETMEPGRVDLTDGAGGSSRTLVAERVKALYGPRSRLERLEGHGKVQLDSRPAQGEPLKSWSDSLEARLEPESGELEKLVQTGHFRFEQIERKGSAESAVWDPSKQVLTMEGHSKVADGSGTIEAHRVVLVEGGDRLEAEGGVTSVFVGESKQGVAEVETGLFQDDEPVYATASTMRSDGRNGLIVYEGEARLWQGRNRIEADRITIDRRRKTLDAEGKVLSLLEERGEPGTAPEMVEIAALRLRYDEGERRAVYTGAVRMKRRQLHVESDALTAKLSPAGADGAAELESARAEGAVRIREIGGVRSAEAEAAEMAPGGETVVLYGKPARAYNESGEETRGEQLTWFSGDNSLRVVGGDERAYTFRRRER
ncbi:MAG: hypothetical protein GC160_28545 [Acidobacteria bacterium]|nr:hypothetical protein [Acidobacteriota bacterium]